MQVITFDALTVAGWSFSSLDESEQGRRDFMLQEVALRRVKEKLVKTPYKVAAAIATLVGGIFYSPLWIAASFIGLSAYKDIHVARHKRQLFTAVEEAKQIAFFIHQTKGNVRRQYVDLITTEGQSSVVKLAKELTQRWRAFDYVLQAVAPICQQAHKLTLVEKKNAILSALTAISQGAKKKKQQFDLLKKNALDLLRSLTEPQPPRGILVDLSILADSAISKAKLNLQSYLYTESELSSVNVSGS